MNCKYKVKIKRIQYNYRVQMAQLQEKYKFNIFCTGGNKEIEEKVNTLYEAWPRVSGTGESITLNNTIQAKIESTLKGNTSQEGTPTPEAPQDIHVVSGDNSIEVVGKNLVFSKIANENISSGGLLLSDNSFDMHIAKVTQGETYTITSNDISNGFVGGFFTSLPVHNTFSYNNQRVVTNSWTFTAPITGYVAFRSQAGYEYAQLEKGNQATPYEPYQSQSYPINLGDIELCKIGDYQDSIVKDNGKWYLNKQTMKGTLNGTESWQYQSKDTGRTVFRLSIDRVSTNVQYLSNMFIYNDLSTLNRMSIVYSDNRIYVSMDNLILGIEESDTNSTRLQKFKTWLGNNPLEICRIAGTPTTTEITDATLISQLEAIKEAESYSGQTNISQTNDDKPFIITATALRDLSNL